MGTGVGCVVGVEEGGWGVEAVWVACVNMPQYDSMCDDESSQVRAQERCAFNKRFTNKRKKGLSFLFRPVFGGKKKKDFDARA